MCQIFLSPWSQFPLTCPQMGTQRTKSSLAQLIIPALPRSLNPLLSTLRFPSLPLQARQGGGHIDGRVHVWRVLTRGKWQLCLAYGKLWAKYRRDISPGLGTLPHPFSNISESFVSSRALADVAVPRCSTLIPDFYTRSAPWLQISTLLPWFSAKPCFLWLGVRKALWVSQSHPSVNV